MRPLCASLRRPTDRRSAANNSADMIRPCRHSMPLAGDQGQFSRAVDGPLQRLVRRQARRLEHGLLLGLRESQAIAERVDNPYITASPPRILNIRLQVLVVALGEFSLKLIDGISFDDDGRAGGCITMVLGKMKDAAAARNLHVKRKVFLESMFPIDRESEEVDIELARLFDIEDSEDGRRCSKFHR